MNIQRIQSKIYELRGYKVLLDIDLAELYEVENKRLKEAVRRNIHRFPMDFMFELTPEEYDILRSQSESLENTGRGKYSKFNAFAFTEQGVAMLSGVLNSPKAIEVNISIIRAFVWMRQYALTHAELSEKLRELEAQYHRKFEDVNEVLNYLLGKEHLEEEQATRLKIGFTNSDMPVIISP